jgi:hypothetical protein
MFLKRHNLAMLINLLDFVLQHLAERRVPWTCVARDTHIPYETLKKIASGRTPNPGVQHVQKLAEYFRSGMLSAQTGPQVPAVNDWGVAFDRPAITAGLVPEGQGTCPAAEPLADPALAFALPAGMALIPERRVATEQRRAADRKRDISQTGQGV